MNRSIWVKYGALVGVNFIYACTGIFTKMASRQEMFSWPYVLWISGAIGVMGVYALLWQQIIKRVPISTAYMFKGTGAVFGLLIVWFVLREPITINNIIGTAFIIAGITLFSKP
jgi:multidrug transporter EmrE-like cation transporter